MGISKLARVLLATSSFVSLGATLGGRARAADPKPAKPLEGAEFVDMPDDQSAKANAPAVAPPDDKETPGYLAGYRRNPSIGLSPFAPQSYFAVPSGMPAFGASTPGSGARFDFHGYMQVPVRVGIGSRANAGPGQSSVTLHGDPLVAGGGYGWLDQVFVVPGPYAQLNFAYGNDVVQANAVLGAWNITESMNAAGYFQAPSQEWFRDAFVTYSPKTDPVALKINVGVFSERYGAMAQYTTGAFGTALIATVFGVGATASAVIPFEYDLDLKLEAGFKGNINHPPANLVSASSNDYASGAYGSTFVPHAHAALTYKNVATLGVHYIDAFTQDDRGDNITDKGTPYPLTIRDGSLKVAGADLTVNGGRFGYLFLGGAEVTARYIESLSNIIQILNTGAGKSLMERYFGYNSQGNGGLTILGGQYTLSLGTLLRYPTEFWGEGPDLSVTLFGLYAHTTSQDPDYDGRDSYKFGAELTYSFLPWLAASGRFDRVVPNASLDSRSFAVLSPKLIFRSDWQTREALTIEYAGWILGDDVLLNGDTRLLNVSGGGGAATQGVPTPIQGAVTSIRCFENGVSRCDKHMVAVYGTMWW